MRLPSSGLWVGSWWGLLGCVLASADEEAFLFAEQDQHGSTSRACRRPAQEARGYTPSWFRLVGRRDPRRGVGARRAEIPVVVVVVVLGLVLIVLLLLFLLAVGRGVCVLLIGAVGGRWLLPVRGVGGGVVLLGGCTIGLDLQGGREGLVLLRAIHNFRSDTG